eukprot:9396706-Pyramimonas_sp.AAC.1
MAGDPPRHRRPSGPSGAPRYQVSGRSPRRAWAPRGPPELLDAELRTLVRRGARRCRCLRG